MAVYFIADTHFGHANIIKYCGRPFTSLEEMNKTLVANWNARVHDNDRVYIAGDLAWRGGYENAIRLLSQLKGIKHLAVGNHDKDFLKKEEYRQQFEEIDKLLFVNLDGIGRVIVCHYPMLEWNGSRRGAWHVHGHIHNSTDYSFQCLKGLSHALNAGVDICQFMPVTFPELRAYNETWKAMPVP